MAAAAALEDTTEKSAVTPGPLAPARELLGEMLLEANQPAKALVEFEANLKKEPNRFKSVYGAARAAELAGDKRKARTYYAQLVKICERGDRPGRPELEAPGRSPRRDSLLPGRDGSGLAAQQPGYRWLFSLPMVTRDLERDMSRCPNCSVNSRTRSCSACGQPKSACSIRVSTRAFVRNWRIVRKKNSVKFFVFNNQQWCESHPLRHHINPMKAVSCSEMLRN